MMTRRFAMKRELLLAAALALAVFGPSLALARGRIVPAAAQAEGYRLMFGSGSGGDFGAMGLHFVKAELVGDDVLDSARPEIVIYEPMPDGRLCLVGLDVLTKRLSKSGSRKD